MSSTWMGGSGEGYYAVATYPIKTFANGQLQSIQYDKNNTNWIEYLYDERGNEILRHTSEKFWQRKEWNKRNDLTYYYNSNNCWHQYDYDENGRVLAFKNHYKEYMNFKYQGDIMIEYNASNNVWVKCIPGILYEDYNGNYWRESMGIENPYPVLSSFINDIRLDLEVVWGG